MTTNDNDEPVEFTVKQIQRIYEEMGPLLDTVDGLVVALKTIIVLAETGTPNCNAAIVTCARKALAYAEGTREEDT